MNMSRGAGTSVYNIGNILPCIFPYLGKILLVVENKSFINNKISMLISYLVDKCICLVRCRSRQTLEKKMS